MNTIQLPTLPNTLQYTLDVTMDQQAVIVRNVAGRDNFGAEGTPDWQVISTTPCKLYWAHSSGVRSAQRTYPTDQRLAPVSDGGVMLPLGTDITELDHIDRILDKEGNLYIDGIFEIVAVVAQITHIELGVFRPHLGA